MDDMSDTAWLQAVRVFLHAKMKQKYLTDDPPDENSHSAETWLWEELLIYQPITPDVDTQCKQREDFQCALFLFSLNPNYDVFKDHILVNESFLSAVNAYSRLERVSNAYTPSVSKVTSAAFISNGRGGSVRGGRGRGGCSSTPHGARGGIRGGTRGGRGGHGPHPDWLCDYCGNIGHTEPFCYKMNGYPHSVHHASKEPSSNNPQSVSTQDDVLSQILYKLNHFTPVPVLPNIDDFSTLGSSPTSSPPSTSFPLSDLVSPSVPMSLHDPLPPPDIVSPSDSVSPSNHVSLLDPLPPPNIVSSSEFVSIPPPILSPSGYKPPPISKPKRAPKPPPAPKSKCAPKPPPAPQSTRVSKPPPASPSHVPTLSRAPSPSHATAPPLDSSEVPSVFADDDLHVSIAQHKGPPNNIPWGRGECPLAFISRVSPGRANISTGS
ncbi:hypothetical protein IFM89_006409 [Coptis chinensis]|uniref:Uncharacterized protein n=1 Tax=Coptis chinensis TaxID=261450 RepID=A0A835HP26_9MAGN|nr:hypothetical protein IFM89_006409 [Coptis chinensis]